MCIVVVVIVVDAPSGNCCNNEVDRGDIALDEVVVVAVAASTTNNGEESSWLNNWGKSKTSKADATVVVDVADVDDIVLVGDRYVLMPLQITSNNDTLFLRFLFRPRTVSFIMMLPELLIVVLLVLRPFSFLHHRT